MKVLIISDVHANPWALEAVLHAVGAVDHVLCAGDLVNYGPRPQAVLQQLRKQPTIAVRGNHDHAVAHGADPRASPAKQPLALALRDWTRGQLNPADLQWLATLPLRQNCEVAGARFTVVHATPADPLYDYRLRPDSPDALLEQLTTGIHADVLVVGHTHWPLRRTVGTLQVVNPGSVGQPLDGDPRASYATWDDGRITVHRVAYDLTPVLTALDAMPADRACRSSVARVLRHACLE